MYWALWLQRCYLYCRSFGFFRKAISLRQPNPAIKLGWVWNIVYHSTNRLLLAKNYYIAQSVISGHTAGDGVYSRKCQQLLEERFNVPQVLLTTSCTTALEMAAVLCNIEEGDKVILPSYTFVSTANVFVLRNAKVIFVDIRPDTLNLDENLLEEAVTERTKAIVPVHYAGVACASVTPGRSPRAACSIICLTASNRVGPRYTASHSYLSYLDRNIRRRLENLGLLRRVLAGR